MQRQFFGLQLADKEKFEFQAQDGLISHRLTKCCLDITKPNSEVKLWGKSNQGSKFMLAHLMSNQKECIPMNLIINEDNLIALYAIGNGILHLTGYTLKMSHDEDLFTLPNE